jgi:hypothetical protein
MSLFGQLELWNNGRIAGADCDEIVETNRVTLSEQRRNSSREARIQAFRASGEELVALHNLVDHNMMPKNKKSTTFFNQHLPLLDTS